MNNTNGTTPDYRCPKHPDERLSNVLRGGAGWCAMCQFFVQALGVPMPELDPHVAAKRAAEAEKKAKPKPQAKPKKKTKKRAAKRRPA
jgi:hypothetical protein